MSETTAIEEVLLVSPSFLDGPVFFSRQLGWAAAHDWSQVPAYACSLSLSLQLLRFDVLT